MLYWVKDASGNVFGPYHSVDDAVDAGVDYELSGELSSNWTVDSNSDPDTEDLLQR